MAGTTNDMASSPRHPLNGTEVLRISGFQTCYLQRITKLRIATINVSTLRDKEEEIIEVMKSRNLEIVTMCETRTNSNIDKTIHQHYRLLCTDRNDGRHGVGIIVTPELSRNVEGVEYVNERIISISIKLKNGGLSLVQVYAPQQDRPSAEKDEFYETLQQVADSFRYRENLILCADLNRHVGCDRSNVETIIDAHSIGIRNEDGQRILDFSKVNNLSIMNTYYSHRESHKYTWYRWNSRVQQYTSKSMIDLSLTNNKNMFRDVKAFPSVSMDSDHKMVIATPNIQIPHYNSKSKQIRYKLEELKMQENRDRLRNKTAEKLE